MRIVNVELAADLVKELKDVRYVINNLNVLTDFKIPLPSASGRTVHVIIPKDYIRARLDEQVKAIEERLAEIGVDV